MTENTTEPFDPAEALSKMGLAPPEEVPTEEIFGTEEEITAPVQFDPTGAEARQPGAKLDGGKIPFWRGFMSYFPNAARAVAAISLFGSQKYTWGGWKTVPDGFNRYSDAMLRHVADEAGGELYDPESNMLHAAHAAWGANARLELLLKEHPLMNPNASR